MILKTTNTIIFFISFINLYSQDLDSMQNRLTNVSINNIIPENSTSIIEIILPLIGVILGFLLSQSKDYIVNYIKDIKQGKEWVENFVQLIEPLKSQIKEMEFFLNKDETEIFKKFELKESLSCTDFETLKPESLVKYLNKKSNLNYKDAVNTSKRMKAAIRIIKHNYEELVRAFENLKADSIPHNEEFFKNFHEFRMKIADYIDDIDSSVNSNKTQKELIINITNLINSEITKHVLNNTPINPNNISKSFVRPFFELSYQDRNHPLMKESIMLLSKVSQSIENNKSEARHFKFNLKNIKESFESNLSELTEITKKI